MSPGQTPLSKCAPTGAGWTSAIHASLLGTTRSTDRTRGPILAGPLCGRVRPWIRTGARRTSRAWTSCEATLATWDTRPRVLRTDLESGGYDGHLSAARLDPNPLRCGQCLWQH